MPNTAEKPSALTRAAWQGQLHFPWWAESEQQRPRFSCGLFGLLAAYAAVQQRMEDRFASERRALLAAGRR